MRLLRRRGLSLRTKLHLVLTGLATCVSVLTVYFFYSSAQRGLLENTRGYLAGLAAAIATSVDVQAHSMLLTPRDESTQAYKDIRDHLRRVRDANTKIRNIYTTQ